MASVDKNGDNRGLSSEQEQEIVNRILERAELAQMTRQLKLNLSKVPNPNNTVDDKGRDTRKKRSNVGGDREIEEAINKVSPKKNRSGTEGSDNGEDNQDNTQTSPVKTYRRPRTPPPAPPASSSSSLRSDKEGVLKRGDIPTTPKPDKSQIVLPIITTNAKNAHEDYTTHDNAMKEDIMTPKRNSHHARRGSENDVAADLLMYLATSPYTSSSSLRGSRNGAHEMAHMPSTPMAYSNGRSASDGDDEAIRFSHIKASISSPQSTFKVPMHIVNNNLPSSASHNELLMDSPSLYMVAASPSPQKRRYVNLSAREQHSNSASSGLLPHVPSTPSRELRTSSSHLLRTPNFNMGDYVHNLFSPSPRGAVLTGASNTAIATQNNTTASTQHDLEAKTNR